MRHSFLVPFLLILLAGSGGASLVSRRGHTPSVQARHPRTAAVRGLIARPHPRTVAVRGLIARPRRAGVVLRSLPGGPVLATLGLRGVFGDPIRLGVLARRGRWLEVTSELLPNGTDGWIERGRGVAVSHTRYALAVSLSAHRLDVLRSGRVVRRIRVAIGAPSSPTPTGTFAVAEKLPGPRFGAVYGCCILGLTAHQTHPPAGSSRSEHWFVAIHGGGGVGSGVSAGCLHADPADLRYLMRTIPAGTRIRIRR